MSKEAKREPKERQETPAPAPAEQTNAPAEQAATPIDPAAEQHKRLEAAELNRVLGHKLCAACATVGCWEVYNRERGADGAGGRVRYIRCKACGHCAQAPVVIPSLKATATATGNDQ